MACFLVSAAVATGTGITRRCLQKKAKTDFKQNNNEKFNIKNRWSERLKYLEMSLWGGSFLLAGEHILHGEIIFYPPFLSAMKSASSAANMLNEMKTVGVGMSLSITIAWFVGILIYEFAHRRKKQLNLCKENA